MMRRAERNKNSYMSAPVRRYDRRAMILISFIAFVVSALVAAAVVRWGRGHARMYGKNKPQRFHSGDVPRLGGAGVVVGCGG
jgi:UDP-N-acetylmuramyl pentapeptide phosphotransferase/UDP-N-acetylglucosamine-1-phosphate transferase